MKNIIPQKIEDVTLVHSEPMLLDSINVVKQIGKFFTISQWHSPTYTKGWMVYDCYVLAWTREGNLKDGEVFAALYYDSIEPKGVIDLWSVAPLLKKPIKNFNLNEFVERIREHRLTGI